MSRLIYPKGHIVKGATVAASFTKELHRNTEVLRSGGKAKTVYAGMDNCVSQEIDLSILPAAAESYHISPDPKDYILVSLPIVTVAIPNRNLQAFALEEVTYFDPMYGSMIYRTFDNKPCHKDHCFPAGTKIRMANGKEKDIESIELGDMVRTQSGKSKPVTQVFQNGIKPVTKLIATGLLEEMYVTENHPVLVVGKGQAFGRHNETTGGQNNRVRFEDYRERGYKPHFRPVSDICVGDYVCIPVHFGGQKKVNPNLAFLLGAFIAEGYYAKNSSYDQGHGIDLICGSHEKEFIAKIIQSAQELGYNPIHRVGVSQGADSIRISSIDLAKNFREWVGEYAHGKFLGNEIKTWDKESVKTLLGAYMSGDGGFDSKKGSYRVRSSSKQLLQDLQQAFAFIGIPTCIGIDEPLSDVRRRNRNIQELNAEARVIMPNHDSGYLRVTNAHIPEMISYLVGKTPTCREKTYDSGRMILQDGYIMSPVVGLEREIISAPVYNFEVEEEHTYIASGLIVHNCNQDPTKAKGLIIDSSMKYIPKFDVWKINIMTLWDRSKDSQLVGDILAKRRTGYSMGASVNAFVCSTCGWSDCVTTPCEHEKGKVYGASSRLCYHLCSGSCYFENSSVEDPADTSSYSTDIFE